MNYSKFEEILNEGLFVDAKLKLLTSIANSPERYSGLFRSTKPRAKMRQNLSQSQEIKFGDAFEEIIKSYLSEYGYKNLERNIIDEQGNVFNLDQHFMTSQDYFFIEQKVRDDHDSTKKQGQISNFKKKLELLLEKYQKKNLSGIFYFVDPSFHKNQNFYRDQINKLKSTIHKDLYLFYGKELFDYLGHSDTWAEILVFLKTWRNELPDFPDTNFDLNPPETLAEIKNLDPSLYMKIFSNRDLFMDTIENIFPTRESLYLLLKFFKENAITNQKYSELENLLSMRLAELTKK